MQTGRSIAENAMIAVQEGICQQSYYLNHATFILLTSFLSRDWDPSNFIFMVLDMGYPRAVKSYCCGMCEMEWFQLTANDFDVEGTNAGLMGVKATYAGDVQDGIVTVCAGQRIIMLLAPCEDWVLKALITRPTRISGGGGNQYKSIYQYFSTTSLDHE
ncbi:hypothetical protein ARMGADRAFT_1027434 [Armillaria gallica]|uniref:Uncharacterized protein n=1 Tax=Armillaria gallica TaxID=47427 RepID=A0A2H3E9K6_ARMGA|nr:hypothetical protein ARMGADRAFT_1027434 [Armillaria gallica]